MKKLLYDVLSILLITLFWIPVTFGCGLYHMYHVFVQYPQKALDFAENIRTNNEEQ